MIRLCAGGGRGTAEQHGVGPAGRGGSGQVPDFHDLRSGRSQHDGHTPLRSGGFDRLLLRGRHTGVGGRAGRNRRSCGGGAGGQFQPDQRERTVVAPDRQVGLVEPAPERAGVELHADHAVRQGLILAQQRGRIAQRTAAAETGDSALPRQLHEHLVQCLAEGRRPPPVPTAPARRRDRPRRTGRGRRPDRSRAAASMQPSRRSDCPQSITS